MTCDFCRSFLHLWRECRDRKEHMEMRRFEAYANAEEYDEDEHEREENEAYDHYEDDATSESDAIIAHHFADLGLMKSLNSPQSRSKKNSSRNFFTDTYIEEFNENEDKAFMVHNLSSLDLTKPSNSPRFRGEENPFWNLYKDTNITLYASQSYKDEEKEEEEDDKEVKNKFFIPQGYRSDDKKEKDENEAFIMKKMLLFDNKEEVEKVEVAEGFEEVKKAEKVGVWQYDI